MGEKAIFLAKDGTLVDDVGHNVDPRRVRLSDAAVSGLRVLRGSGFRLVVVSNQSGVARGYFSGKELLDVERALGDLLSYHGLGLDGFYYCPHHPNGVRPEYAVSCVCRKPKPELLTRAAAELDLDLARSWVVGDVLDDVEAGLSAGCRAVLVDNGSESEWRISETRLPHHVAPDIEEAARLILEEEADEEEAGRRRQAVPDARLQRLERVA